MNIELIYASWPNRPNGIGWCNMAGALRKAGLTNRLKRDGFQVNEHDLTATGDGAGDLKAAFELAAQIGALSGLGGEDTGILWMDAHPDLNTPETTMSGLFEGMAAAILLGDAWQTLAIDVAGLSAASRRNLCFYGARDIDSAERTMIEDDAIPIVEDAKSAIDVLEGCERAYIHLDMDVHNAALMRVNRFSGDGGPSPDEVRQTLADITAALPVAAIGLTGLDPDIGAQDGAVACAIDHIITVCEARRTATA